MQKKTSGPDRYRMMMPARDKEPAVMGHNEETFEYFTKLAKIHKANVLKSSEALKDKHMEKIDITEVHSIINKNHNIKTGEAGSADKLREQK